MNLAPTPGQTVGPFFSFALVREAHPSSRGVRWLPVSTMSQR